MMNKRDQLEKVFKESFENKSKYVFVEIFMEGFPSTELIVNPTTNIIPKMEYYLKTYDENLNHKFSKCIRILNFGATNDLGLLEYHYHAEGDK
ncbi:hypothetical protein NT98_5943 (plasmid) [Bacillus cereus]|uniref:hypothetical protein n=1 Tax=Bacillus tropicus TaxID=2026188 RepID=UPI00031448A8|nr:hypothetical protein [Bacillus tropicus]AIY72787.1 hypothetical protein NT98_5943 [Bacillus cereus]AJI02665.1 hypothetical protein AQ16_5821 [Bacillus cereus G9241]ARO21612.1 hypothetical protein B2J90_29850 [Bacillus cereus]KDB40962.1 hypothetical protein DH31_11960 [Bacillus cereus]QPS48241.1 hypothetical protein I6G54_01170 [Bacillus tropicus]